MTPFFVTGTDTHVGKTYVSSLLLDKLAAHGYQTFGIKPIASGCQHSEAHTWHNEDALTLQAHASISRDYAIVNPIALPEPIAPHLAAQRIGLKLSAQYVADMILSSIQCSADINLIEGVGGWYVPLNDHESMADVIRALRLPVILVVGMKLGCLNHAIMTYQHIQQSGVPLIGWVANCIEPTMQALQENLETLQRWIHAPCLGRIAYQATTGLDSTLILEQLAHHGGIARGKSSSIPIIG